MLVVVAVIVVVVVSCVSTVRRCTLQHAFLRVTAATAVVRLSHRNFVCPSVCHMAGSVKNGAN